MAVSYNRADISAQQDIVLLRYLLGRHGASWENFMESFDQRAHEYIRERLHILTLKGYLTHNLPCDGYSDNSQAWKLTPKGESHV